jgi:pimeloyl-ACP methyl ester carboxylesterase
VNLEEQFIQTNGIRLHVVEAGPKSGPPVILLHGFPEFWYGWRKQIPALAEAGFRVIVPDQRGYNLSDKPKGMRAYKLNELSSDILGLIDALEYEKVNLVGHDWGGVVAWALGIRNPERLHRLSIMNVPHPAVMKRFLQRDIEQLRRSWYAILFQLPWIPERGMMANHWRGAERVLRGSRKIHTFTNEDIAKYKEAWSQPNAMTSMINWYRAAFRYQPPTPKDPRVKIPTLMLWGINDAALSHRMARPSMDYCEDGKLVLFEDSTHWVQLDAAEQVNKLLIDFIRK